MLQRAARIDLCFCSMDRDLSGNHAVFVPLLSRSSTSPFLTPLPLPFPSFPFSVHLVPRSIVASHSLSYLVRMFVHSCFRTRGRIARRERERSGGKEATSPIGYIVPTFILSHAGTMHRPIERNCHTNCRLFSDDTKPRMYGLRAGSSKTTSILKPRPFEETRASAIKRKTRRPERKRSESR